MHSVVAADESTQIERLPLPGRATGVSERGALFYRTKQALDLVSTVILLLVLSPLLLLIALAILLESGRPIIFSHDRVGARRRCVSRGASSGWELTVFRFFKFRSMVVGADPAVHKAHIESFVHGEAAQDDGSFKLRNDARVTRVGRVLRASSLDELPQLVNVLRGEMSLVGPRPLPAYEVELYEPEHFARFTAPSGVTGLWQVEGRAQNPFAQMIELDIAYVSNQSLARDLSILLRTPAAVLTRNGAG